MCKYALKYLPVLLCIYVFLSICVIQYGDLDIHYLHFTGGDEIHHFYEVLTIFDGMRELDVEKTFRYGTYVYGFVYYLYNLILMLPFILSDNTQLMIYAPRVGVAITAVALLVVVYRFSRLYLDTFASSAILICTILMPGFWSTALSYKPNMMMSLFIAVSVTYYSKDAFRYGRNYVLGVVMFGVAIGMKFHAVYFFPFALFYATFYQLHDVCFNPKMLDFKLASRRLAFSFFVPIAVWIIMNPFVLHARGFGAWYYMFDLNMRSNATNHGSYIDVSLIDKLDLIHSCFFPYPVMIILFLVLLYAAKMFLSRGLHGPVLSIGVGSDHNPMLVLIPSAFFVLVTTTYMFVKVNKTWESYYLGIVVGGLLLLVFFMAYVSSVGSMAKVLGSATLVAVFAFYNISNIAYRASHQRDTNLAQALEHASEILDTLKSHAADLRGLNIATTNPSFDFTSLGLTYRNIHTIVQFSDQLFDFDCFMAKSNSKNPRYFVRKDILILPLEYLSSGSDRDASSPAESFARMDEGLRHLMNSDKWNMFATSRHYMYFRMTDPSPYARQYLEAPTPRILHMLVALELLHVPQSSANPPCAESCLLSWSLPLDRTSEVQGLTHRLASESISSYSAFI